VSERLERTRHPGVYRRGEVYVGVVRWKERGTWRAKWIPANPSIREVQAARRRFLEQVERGLRPAGAKRPLGDYLRDVWLPEIERTRRPSSVRTYRSVVERHIVPLLGEVQLGELGRDEVKALHHAMTPTPSLAKLAHAVLSSALSYAVKDLGVVAVNACSLVRPPSVHAKETAHLDPEEARRMLSVARGDRLEPAIMFGLLGGLRIGEVCGLTWADLDLDDVVVMVRGSWWGPTKSGKPRGVTLPVFCGPALRRWKLHQAEEMLAVGVPQEPADHVLTDEVGEPVSPAALRRTFGRFCEKNGFGITFHGLRHSATILMLRMGLDVRTVADRLGHATPELIFSTYSHWIAAADRDAAEKLGRVLTSG
jgi:integrase